LLRFGEKKSMILKHVTLLFCGSLAVLSCRTGGRATSESGLKDLSDGSDWCHARSRSGDGTEISLDYNVNSGRANPLWVNVKRPNNNGANEKVSIVIVPYEYAINKPASSATVTQSFPVDLRFDPGAGKFTVEVPNGLPLIDASTNPHKRLRYEYVIRVDIPDNGSTRTDWIKHWQTNQDFKADLHQINVDNRFICGDKPQPIQVAEWGALTLPSPNDYNTDTNGPTATSPNNDLAGKTVLQAMYDVRDTFQTDVPAHVTKTQLNNISKSTVSSCLANTAYHWSDIVLHYYCQHGYARSCYTANAAGGRIKAHDTCKTDTHFKWIDDNQADIFKYIMFSQVYAFNLEQQNAVINSFYGVQDPYDFNECRQKRPVRAIDPRDGSHCQWFKQNTQTPRDIGR
jgi:hypothetical protein